jgi:hypothetical protein
MGRGPTKKDRHGVSLRKLRQLEAEARDAVYLGQEYDTEGRPTGTPYLRVDLPDAPLIGKRAIAAAAGYRDPDYLIRLGKENATVRDLGDGRREYSTPHSHMYGVRLPGKRGEVYMTHPDSAATWGNGKRAYETAARRERVVASCSSGTAVTTAAVTVVSSGPDPDPAARPLRLIGPPT